MKMKKCFYCNYTTKDCSNYRKHIQRMHSVASTRKHAQLCEMNHIENVDRYFHGEENIDIQLKENFKLFISGPSRCGKTVFVAKLIENIQSFAQQPPTLIIYVYKVWQDKYDEMGLLGVNFMEDNENIVEKIKSAAQGQRIMVVFDDLIGSNSLQNIANLFTVDARHVHISMVFLTVFSLSSMKLTPRDCISSYLSCHILYT